MRKERPKMSDPRLIQSINYPQLQIVADPMTVNINNTKPNNNNIITTLSSDTRKAIFKRKRPPQSRDSSLSDLPIQIPRIRQSNNNIENIPFSLCKKRLIQTKQIENEEEEEEIPNEEDQGSLIDRQLLMMAYERGKEEGREEIRQSY